MLGQLLEKSLEGQKFLLNFIVCQDDGLIHDTDRLRVVVEEVAKKIATKRAAGDPVDGKLIVQLFESEWITTFRSYSSPMCTASSVHSNTDLGVLGRILDVDYLILHPKWALLDRTAVLNAFPMLGHDDKFDPALHRIIESMNGVPGSAKVGAEIRGSMPVAFFASTEDIDAKLTSLGQTKTASSVRDVLATLHDAKRDLFLYILKVPPSVYESVNTYRPTFAEAGTNPYFRAKLPVGSQPEYGLTVSLSEASKAKSFSEGVREVIAVGLTMTNEVAWEALGPIKEHLPPIDHTWWLSTFAADPAAEIRRARLSLEALIL